MDYISVKEASRLWGIDTSRIGRLAREGRIAGAKIVGRSWLIPKDAKKPSDGRFKNSEADTAQNYFRFPFFAASDINAFDPPLSKEEKLLRNAQNLFFSCDFENSLTEFELLCENAGNIYVKITALYFMCVLSVAYDNDLEWDKYYTKFNLLLSRDFSYKKEMELLRPLLNCYIGKYLSVSEAFVFDENYDYHPSVYYLCEYLLLFRNLCVDTVGRNSPIIELYEMLCRQIEFNGHYFEAQCVHHMLFVYYYLSQNEARMIHHLRRVLTIAYEHNMIFEAAAYEPYYSKEYDRVLSEFPAEFAGKIRFFGKQTAENYAIFTKEKNLSGLYSDLSKTDLLLILYSTQGYSNKQTAAAMHISERTVANKLSEIYGKLGVSGKKELMKLLEET